MVAITLSNAHYKSLLNTLQKQFPAKVLSEWKITALSGLGGGSFHIQQDEINWIARHYNAEKKTLFVNAQKEHSILKQLKSSGLSPHIVMSDGEWFFLHWEQGQHPTHQQLFDSYMQPLAEKVAMLHQRTPFGFPLNLCHELSFYWYHIDKRRLSPRWLRLHQHFLRQPRRNLIKYAPAHMDLHPENILLSEQGIKFIDWEYAADIDIADSLMSFFAINQLDDMQQSRFLHYYCSYHYHHNRQEEIIFSSVEKIKSHILSRKPFIFYMMLMWYEVRWQQTKNESFLVMSEPLRDYFSLIS